MKKFTVLLIVFVLISLIFTSCGNSENKRDTMYNPEPAADTSMAFYEGPMEKEYLNSSDSSKSGDFSGSEDISIQNDLNNRKVIKNAYMTFQTTEYDSFLNSFEACVKKYGGYTENSTMNSSGIYSKSNLRFSSITVRIPADNYELFISETQNIGKMTYKNEGVSDVTNSYIDIESRLETLRAEKKALQDILENSKEIYDIIALHDRLSDINYEIENYERQIRKYDDLISYSTVNVEIQEVEKIAAEKEEQTVGQRMSEGLNESFENVIIGLQDFSVSFVSSLPYIAIWLIIIIIIALIILFVIKKHKKNKKKRIEAYNKKIAEQYVGSHSSNVAATENKDDEQ